jgi:hypothetical protein
MFAAFNSCVCDLLSELRVATQSGYARTEVCGNKIGIEQVIDQVASRMIQLEVMDRKCINEAGRHKASGAKGLFRDRMHEHHRIQKQLLQLQRYRDSALAHLDAVSNHEINQTFVRAIQSAGGGKKGVEIKEAVLAIEDLQETVSHAQQLSDLLGQPTGEEITDEDLDVEFLEFISTGTETTAPMIEVKLPEVPSAKTPAVRPLDLRVQEMFSMA